MTQTLESVREAEIVSATSFVNGWHQKFSPRWVGRGLATELGARAYGALVVEARRCWPPGLCDYEELMGL